MTCPKPSRLAANFSQLPKPDHDQVSHSVDPPSPATDATPVVICQVTSISKFTVSIQIGDKPVTAVVDTAAQVTIISDKVYHSLKHKPPVLRKVQLMAAGREMSMQGFIAGPVKFKIGHRWYQEDVYVAPIEQEMLLGFDILRNKGQAILDMGRGILLFDGMEISLDEVSTQGSPTVARVTVSKRRVIPPQSVAKVKCDLSQDLPDYVIEPTSKAKFMMPRVVRKGGTAPVVCVVNPSDRYKLITKGTEIARAYPVEEILEDSEDLESVFVQSVSEVSEGVDQDTSSKDKGGIPEHLKQLYKDASKNLDEDQQIQLAQLLIEFQDVFATDDFDLGNFTAMEHVIETGDAKPIKQRLRRTPACFAGVEEAHLKKMLDAGVIQESTSDWASAPVLIKKRDGTVRYCIDYRAVNDVTVKDMYPLPLIDDCLDTVAGSIWFSKLDANSAYWQIHIREEDRKKTAFLTKYGLYEHVRMGFGLCGAPATFSRAMNLILRGLTWKTVLAFLDDILVLGTSFSDHLKNLREALLRFRQYGLKLKPRKCALYQQEVEFLGRKVGPNMLALTDSDIAVVRDWPVPTCAKHVERFMGLANYHRGFIKDFSNLAAPLYAVVGKHSFVWSEEQDRAFQAIKKALSTPPVLALPNQSDTFVLDTDASNLAIGAVLSQIQDGKERVIAYGSYALTKEQRRYCVTRKELLAVVRFTRQFRHYLLGKPFVVRTDHSSLRWLTKFREPQGQLARWLEELSQYNMVLRYRAGRDHGNADALSRLPFDRQCDDFRSDVRLEELPCGGCKYCAKAQENWGSFKEVVDDVVPLGTKNGNSTPLAKESRTVLGIQEVDLQEIIHGKPDETESAHPDDGGKPGGLTEVTCFSVAEIFGNQPDAGEWVLGGPVDTDVTTLERVIAHIPWDSEETSEGEVVSVNVVTRSAAKDRPTNTLISNQGDRSNQRVSKPAIPVGQDTDTSNSTSVNAEVERKNKRSSARKTRPTNTSPNYQGDGPGSVMPLGGDVDQGDSAPANAGAERGGNCSWGFSVDDLVQFQSKDPELTLVLAWLKTKEDADPSVLFRSSPAVKYYWLNKDQLVLIDGVLYQNEPETEDKRLILPQELKERAMTLNHNLPSAGHQGVQRTKERIKEKFFWYGMSKDINQFVLGCEVCNQNKKASRPGKCPMTEYQAGAPMERIHIDFLVMNMC